MKFRKEIKLPNKLIIVKLSSLAVTFTDGHLNLIQVKQICSDISELIKKKKLNIIIVSSGSINAGRNLLPKKRKEEISFLQACSSIGQPILMNMFAQEFKQYGLFTSQVLLTHEDLKNKKRSHNIRGSISTLLKHGIIPILNENDCVSFDEITVGDNDQLSAMICETMNADLLCMLTGADGLYSKDPTQEDAIHYPIIHYEDELKDLSTLSQKSVGRGGMKTKLQAIRKLTPLGTGVVIGSYTKYTPILRLLCQQSGTLFTADNNPSNLKKRSWILTRVRDHAIIKIDQGAKLALEKNASLLPIGILSTSGKFSRGDSVLIKHKNQIVGNGITEYSSNDIEKIKQLKSHELITILGHVPSKVIIHKDNLILK